VMMIVMKRAHFLTSVPRHGYDQPRSFSPFPPLRERQLLRTPNRNPPLITYRSLFDISHNVQEVPSHFSSTVCGLNGLRPLADIFFLGNSGLARTLRSSAFVRPTVARCAFQPLKTNFAPALASRFASTEALNGKVYQVIGAVVDGR